MHIKRIYANDTRTAMKKLKTEFGEDAVILGNVKRKDGIEIIAAIDYDESVIKSSFPKIDEKKSYDADYIKKENPNNQLYEIAKKNTINNSNVKIDSIKNISNNIEKNNSRPEMISFSHKELDNLQKPIVDFVKEEMESLREFVRLGMKDKNVDDIIKYQSNNDSLFRKLESTGLNSDICVKIFSSLKSRNNSNIKWIDIVKTWANNIIIKNDLTFKLGGIISLCGQTGAGKTTIAAKIAASFAALHGSSSVAILSLDNHHLGAYEQLSCIGKELDIFVMPIESAVELNEALQNLKDKKLIIIDTAGAPQSSDFFKWQVKSLECLERRIRNYLIIPANVQNSALNEVISSYSALKIYGCILTKLDEATSIGSALSAVYDNKIPVCYTSSNQDIIETVIPASSKKLVKTAINLTNEVAEEKINFSKYSINRANTQHYTL